MVKRIFPVVTVADIEQMPDDHGLTRYEVIDGELYESSEPHIDRQAIIGSLCFVFGRMLDAHHLGKAFPMLGVHLRKRKRDDIVRNFSYLIPDFAYVSNERFAEVTDGAHFVDAPDLVVEVILPGDQSQHECRLKRDLFKRIAVQDYWIVDSEQRTIIAHQPSGIRAEFAGDDEVTSPVLPALRFAASELFIS